MGPCWRAPFPRADSGASRHFLHLGYRSPNEKLNHAAIGAGGKGWTDINGCRSENLVAMADPDDKRAERAFKAFPKAPKYKDFRKMLDKEGHLVRNRTTAYMLSPNQLAGLLSIHRAFRSAAC
jgi:hypothetical protein